MVDFHSHILPGIDDGSKNPEESVQLLDMLGQQGVSLVVATPHFYADQRSVDRFLFRRQEAYAQMSDRLRGGHPQVRLGAEVRYYPGISRLDGLDRLCIEGTRVLLLEMPVTRWSESTLREVLEIAVSHNLTLVLAHIERYVYLQRPGVFEELLNNGVLMQVNASFFTEWLTRRRAFKLLEHHAVHLLGSDCHGVRNRPPQMGEATHILRKKYGEEFLEQMSAFAKELIVV